MMSFCKGHLPSQARAVLNAATSRRVEINERLFCLFIDACLSATPPMLQDALDAYAKLGPRSCKSVHAVARICRASNQPRFALPLVADAVRLNVDISDDLWALLAECCAE
ncbi:Pentacotripeptide-repeat region of PRORP domain-containing protein [Plasmodiophora brassicae]